jgi:hypothetical protein
VTEKVKELGVIEEDKKSKVDEGSRSDAEK